MAERAPPFKQAKTARGHTFFGDVVVYHESETEHRVSTILRAYGDIREIHSQYPKVEWIDDDGVIHHHTFDYFIVAPNGLRVAIAVKDARKEAVMTDLMGRIIANGITGIQKDGTRFRGIADAVLIATNKHATIDHFDNATAILMSRRHHNDAECVALLNVIQQMPGVFRFGQLLLNAPSPARRRTGVWRLIDHRYIEPVNQGRIDELSWLRVTRQRLQQQSI